MAKPAKKKAAPRKRPAVKDTAEAAKKEEPELDSRAPLDAETALEVIEADHEQDETVEDGGTPGWPETVTITLGDVTYEYATSPADDVLAYVQITFLLDSTDDGKLQSFIEAILAPGEHAFFVDDMRTYLRDQRKKGEPIEAEAFFRQIGEDVIGKFTAYMSPKGSKPSTGRRRTGRRSKSRR